MGILDIAHGDGLVVGLEGVSGVLPRTEIDVLLLKHPNIFNLLLIALMELKGEEVPWEIDKNFKVTKADKMSYYQLAGIHGLPRAEWDYEKAPGKKPTSKDLGYRPHSIPTFGTWHRPYLAMVEQTLYRQIANVAERFSRSKKLTEKEKLDYFEAAQQFRLPYWDYYRPRDYKITIPGVFDGQKTTAPYDYHAPWIFTLPEVMVKTLPDNELVRMRNPLFQYSFATTDLKEEEWKASDIDVTLSRVKGQTLRHAGNESAAVNSMNQALNKIREDEMRLSLAMIERGEYSNFKYFSTARAVSIPGRRDDPSKIIKNFTGSIESLHNNYHVYTGGFAGARENIKTRIGGHMSCVPVAAFDPIFWFHHCQIDRLFAIWQAVNESHWFHELDPRDQHLARKALIPFRQYPLTQDADERYWTSDRARDCKVFGYTYPDISDKQSAEQIRDEFAKNYGWSRRLSPFQPFGKPSPEMEPLDISGAQVYQYPSSIPSQIKPLNPRAEVLNGQLMHETFATKARVSQEYYVDSIVERMAMNGSFTIFYIIGEVAGDSGQEWSRLPGFVGATHIFTAPREACDNCNQQEQQAQLVTSTSPITSLLLDYVENGSLNSMELDDVKPFLVKNLKWRAQTALGRVIDPRNLAADHSFKLSVSSKTSPLPGEHGTVTYGFYPEVIDQIIGNAS